MAKRTTKKVPSAGSKAQPLVIANDQIEHAAKAVGLAIQAIGKCAEGDQAALDKVVGQLERLEKSLWKRRVDLWNLSSRI
jgi:hypothetical protein